MTRSFFRSSFALLGGLVLALSACHDSTSPTATGSIAIEFNGLPSGTTGQVRLTHGAVSKTVSQPSTIEGLDAGEWTITASPVTADGVVYEAQPASFSVNVPARSVGSARVVWTPSTGGLALSILGLPAGTAGDVQVTGPGITRVVTASTVITGLTPGSYTVTARDVRATTGTFRSSLAQQIVNISASVIATSAAVSYAPAPAAVDVVVTGIPTSSPAAITLAPPNGGVISVTGNTRLTSVSAGRWQMAAGSVQANGATYIPTPSSRDTSVSPGDTLRFAVNYGLTTGSIAVAMTGLPGGSAGKATITGPGGFTFSLTSTTTVTDLVPGTYTVVADTVVRDGLGWLPTPVTQTVVVTASLVASPVNITYQSISGTLVVSVSNVPAGVAGSVRIVGPFGFDRTIDSRTVFSPAAIGQYTITAASIVKDNIRYDVLPATVNRTVTLGGRDSVDMRYENLSGSLRLTVQGLPDGVDAAMTLVGPSNTTSLTGTTTVPNLSPGQYTLNAAIVTVGNTAYAPSPTQQTLTIQPRTELAANVQYSVTTVPIDFVLDRAYLTQATQRPDGSIALVAGRDALLRVFAHADRSNGAQPTVRALVYEGATLVQTYTLNAPIGGVPVSLNEGLLSSTWNVVIPGANIRPNLRFVVDIDPTNTVSEADESNNRWPSDGTPRNVEVNVVPPFNVRFVPVTVGSKTGNVTSTNMNTFLNTARRVWPLLDVNASVRVPFTSSADTLISDDGNSKWLTVLSEINSLRSADGASSTTHYFGVVKVGYSSGVAGYGYVPGRAAVGWDVQPSGDGVAAHEWGHNFNRPHAPCGGAAGPDASFPYSGGEIGVYGWNSATNQVVLPFTRDLMGYCNPTWISDYNWSRAMTYRQSSSSEAASASGEGLLVWGRVVNGKVLLEPAFRINAPITPAASSASHRVEALDADGSVLLDVPINAPLVDHVTDHEERQFSVVLPWTAALEQALAQVRVRDVRSPLVAAIRQSATAETARRTRSAPVAQPLEMPDPSSVVETVSSGRVRVRWNTAAYPMAMVRDAATGQIMAYVRNSGGIVASGGRTLDVVYSDGVRSLTRRVRPQ